MAEPESAQSPRYGRASRRVAQRVEQALPESRRDERAGSDEALFGQGSSFIPWALPAALALMLGIVLRHASLPWWALTPWALLALPLVWRRHYLWLPLLLLIPLGYGRMAWWQQQPNPLAQYMLPGAGAGLELTGVSDGRYLRLESIHGVPLTHHVRVVLSPKDSVAAGRVRIRGDITQVSGKRNPGGFDYRAWLRRRGVMAQVYVDAVLSREARAHPSLMTRAQRGVSLGLSARSAALMQAMTLGIRDDLGDLRDSFAAAGLAHILALSGLHVGVLAAALGLLLLPLGRLRYLLIIGIIAGFVVLVGASPSVLRAGLMVAAALLSLYLGAGRIDVWASLGLSALAILLYNPSYLFDLSFQLSYLAVAGIVLFSAPLLAQWLPAVQRSSSAAWWQRLYRHPGSTVRALVLGSIAVSISAQLLSLPLVLSTFHRLPLFSPLINLVAVPLAMLLVPLGFASSVLGMLAPPLARGINVLLTEPLASVLTKLAALGAQLPALHWGAISWLGYLYYGIALLALWLWLRSIIPLRHALLLLASCLAGSLLSAGQRLPEVVFLDVGQGDSTLIRLPQRVEILMDGGGTPFSDFDVGSQTVVPALRALDVDELEIVIASHADTDHIEGLISVLETIPSQVLLVGHPPREPKAVYDRLLTVAAARGVEVIPVRRGQRIRLPQVQLDILNPPHQPYPEDNDNSVVAVITVAASGKKLLLLGDVSRQVERSLAFPDVDIVLAGHHGSPSSTSLQLLEAARPETAVLSYGRNSYGHPSPEVRQRLESLGVDIRETFAHGAVRLSLR